MAQNNQSRLYIVIPVINCFEMTVEAINSIKTPCTVILIDNASDDGTQQWGKDNDGKDIGDGKNLIYIRNNDRKGVAESWNWGIKRAFEDEECQYVGVLNNDVVLHPKTLPHLMAFIDKTNYLMVTADNIKDRMSKETMLMMELPEPFTDYDCNKITDWRAEGPDFSCFLITRKTIEVIGWFDENFHGAYCEDQDFHARCQRARVWAEQYNDQNIKPEYIHFKRLSTAPFFHYASQTIAQNTKLRVEISVSHRNNQNYYLEKWGFDHPEVMDGQGNIQPFGNAEKNWRMW